VVFAVEVFVVVEPDAFAVVAFEVDEAGAFAVVAFEVDEAGVFAVVALVPDAGVLAELLPLFLDVLLAVAVPVDEGFCSSTFFWFPVSFMTSALFSFIAVTVEPEPEAGPLL
jgi:hypothetical protein